MKICLIILIGSLLLSVSHIKISEDIACKVKPAIQVLPSNIAVVTTYSNKFEGRKMANGKVFRHRDRVLACRGGNLGRQIELRYGRNGQSTCTLSDRGRLPLHRRNRWQFDVSQSVAKDLGLYRVVNGKPDRKVYWRYVDIRQDTN